jgi:hypothetical protein
MPDLGPTVDRSAILIRIPISRILRRGSILIVAGRMRGWGDVGDEDVLGVGLSEAIAVVRAELELAVVEGEGSELAFRAGPIEMEFQVGFSRTGTIGAGVRAWVVSAGAKGEASSSGTHRLKLSFTPVRRADGTDALIGDEGKH